MRQIGEVIQEKNLQLDTVNPVLQGGFTQVPNFILKDPNLAVGAKVAYAMFLSYAWNNDSCFPGQDRLAQDMGMTRPRVMQNYGVELIAPNKVNRRVPTQDGRPLRRYRKRRKIERLFAWLFNFRRLVVRYEYHAENFQGFVHLAAAIILLRHL